MYRVVKYLEKQNMEYKKVQFGSSYFYNANPVVVDAIHVSFPGFNHMAERKILSYCKRYGYTVAFSGFNNRGSWLYIFKPSDYETYILYEDYAKKSTDDCERYIHDCHLQNIDVNSNRVKEIMDKYGRMYLAQLPSIA